MRSLERFGRGGAAPAPIAAPPRELPPLPSGAHGWNAAARWRASEGGQDRWRWSSVWWGGGRGGHHEEAAGSHGGDDDGDSFLLLPAMGAPPSLWHPRPPSSLLPPPGGLPPPAARAAAAPTAACAVLTAGIGTTVEQGRALGNRRRG
jgi:hypothetical protein